MQPLRRLQVRQAGAHHLEGAHGIDAQDALERLRIQRVPGGVRSEQRNARVVDQGIDPAPGVDRRGRQRAAIGVLRDVAPDQQRLRAGVAAGRLGCQRLLFAARVIDQHVPAAPRQRQRRGGADAGARTGDDRDLAWFVHGVSGLRRDGALSIVPSRTSRATGSVSGLGGSTVRAGSVQGWTGRRRSQRLARPPAVPAAPPAPGRAAPPAPSS